MRTPKRRDTCTVDREDVLDTDLADECEAFLAGSLVETLHARRVFAPVWTWLNEAAHASEAEILALIDRVDDEADVEARTRSVIARAVACAACDRDLRRLQREILIPLELRIAGTVLTPRRLIELVGRSLYL